MAEPPPAGSPSHRDTLEARLAAIVVSSDDAIISKDLNGVIQSWNEAAERIFGYTAEEIIGESVLRLIPPERHPEETDILARIRSGERIEHFRTVRMRKDGTRVFITASISPIADASGRIVGASKVLRDITRTSALEATYEAIIASADDAIVSKTLEGIVVSWNPAAEYMFGYSAQEMIGQPLLRLFPAERVHEEAEILARIRKGDRVDHFETVRLHRSGRALDVSVTISPIRGPTGEVIGASKVARDITALKALMRERESLLAREQDARKEAERSNRLKDEFLATLSHQLRTPLNAILGWAQLLRSTTAPAELGRGLETIERNARAQAKLVEDLLDVSRIVSGNLNLHFERVELADIVVERVQSLRPTAAAKSIQLGYAIEPGVMALHGDPQRLRQIVWNLLTNAIRYSRPGGRVEVTLRRTDDGLELEVKDDGIGIPQDFLPAVFDRFSQADSSSTRRHSGLGLGLAIVRHLVELHGGVVSAASPGPDAGATFTVRLPVAAAHAVTMAAPAAAPTSRGSSVALDGLNVLVVDDNEDALAVAAAVLESAGARVCRAGSAGEARRLLEQHPIDVVLSDIAMPDEDGYALLHSLRAAGRDLPAIALTAFAHLDDVRRARDAGFAAHVAKPMDPAAMVATVARVVRRTG